MKDQLITTEQAKAQLAYFLPDLFGPGRVNTVQDMVDSMDKFVRPHNANEDDPIDLTGSTRGGLNVQIRLVNHEGIKSQNPGLEDWMCEFLLKKGESIMTVTWAGSEGQPSDELYLNSVWDRNDLIFRFDLGKAAINLRGASGIPETWQYSDQVIPLDQLPARAEAMQKAPISFSQFEQTDERIGFVFRSNLLGSQPRFFLLPKQIQVRLS